MSMSTKKDRRVQVATVLPIGGFTATFLWVLFRHNKSPVTAPTFQSISNFYFLGCTPMKNPETGLLSLTSESFHEGFVSNRWFDW